MEDPTLQLFFFVLQDHYHHDRRKFDRTTICILVAPV
jgi:hypothetical protein